MSYTIKQFNESSGQLTIQFDGLVSSFSVDVPITQDGLYITGEELDTYIKGFAPTDFINRNKQIAAGVPNASDIAALVQPTDTTQTAEELAAQEATVAAAEATKAAEIEKYVKAALIKNGIISV